MRSGVFSDIELRKITLRLNATNARNYRAYNLGKITTIEMERNKNTYDKRQNAIQEFKKLLKK